jgi:hypothetical protein
MFVVETKRTPANGKCYYSSFLDITITIYRSEVAVFYDRKFSHSNKPVAFKKRKTINRRNGMKG